MAIGEGLAHQLARRGLMQQAGGEPTGGAKVGVWPRHTLRLGAARNSGLVGQAQPFICEGQIEY